MNALIFWALMAIGSDPLVVLPSSMNAKPGRLIQITAKTEQRAVKWYLIGEDADLIVMESTKTAIFSASNPGTYRVLAWVAVGDVPSDAAVSVITVGGPLPGPLVDPLLAPAQAIYSALAEPGRDESRRALAGAYRAVSAKITPEIKTTGDLYTLARSTVGAALPDSALSALRDRFGQELASVLPGDASAPLDAATAGRAAALFARLATILENLK